MGFYCIGSYTRALLSCTVKGETQGSFCPKLFKLLDKSVEDTLTEESIGQILGGGQNLNIEWINAAKKLPPAYVERYFYQIIRPCIEDQKKEQLVLGLKQIIAMDAMKDDIELGSLASMTKREFLNMTVVPLTQVLADLFLYAVIHTENKDQKKFLKTIKKTYCDQFADQKDTIRTYEAEAVRPLKSLSESLRGKTFKKTFVKIYESTLGLTKPNHMKIYRVDLDDSGFIYDRLQGFVENSIGYYLLSRTRVRELFEDEEEARVYREGIRLLKARYQTRHQDMGDVLGELLLYAFMEKELSAPKIMSMMEIGNADGFSDSIHMIKLAGDSIVPEYQIVFGTSKLVGDLPAAIDDALAKVQKIRGNRRRERRLIDPSTLRMILPTEEAEAVKKIVIPDDMSLGTPPDAFGILLGYSVDVQNDGSLTDGEYEKAVAEKLKEDVESHIDYILSCLAAMKLTNHSFYIYLLPFNDVDADKKAIMAQALGEGGVAS